VANFAAVVTTLITIVACLVCTLASVVGACDGSVCKLRACVPFAASRYTQVHLRQMMILAAVWLLSISRAPSASVCILDPCGDVSSMR
jgi:hypothetical protein